MAINLDKTTFYVLREHGPNSIWKNRWEVVFLHSDRKGLRAKAGIIKDPFGIRYGVDVYTTYNGEDFWSQSGVTMPLMKALSDLYENKTSELPVLDTTVIRKNP